MAMLTKLFNLNKIKPSTLMNPDNLTKPLRIIHAGGLVECYYMAVSAGGIMQKYPKSILARPEVFHRPWESLVRPEEILTPGEKFYIVPRGTFRKLQKRIRRPSAHLLAVEESETKGDSDIYGKYMEAKLNTRKPSLACSNGQGTKVLPLSRKKVRFVDVWEPSLVSINE